VWLGQVRLCYDMQDHVIAGYVRLGKVNSSLDKLGEDSSG